MDPAAADFYEEDGKDLDFYDFEPLPTLPEDEVSPRRALGPPPFPTEGFAESPQAPCPGPGPGSRGILKPFSPPAPAFNVSPRGDRTVGCHLGQQRVGCP